MLIKLYTETANKKQCDTHRTQGKKYFKNQATRSEAYFISLYIALLKASLLLKVLLSLEVFSILDKASFKVLL